MAVASPSEQRRVAAQLRSESMSVADVAAVLRERYGLGGMAACRQARGWSQTQAANHWCAQWPDWRIEQKTLSGWESWPDGKSARMPSLRAVGHLAQLYGVAASDVLGGFADYRSTSHSPPGYRGEVDRRTFLSVTAGAGAAVSLNRGFRIGAGDVDRFWGRYWTLWHADEAQGGAAVHQGVLRLLSEVRGLLDTGRYGPTIGRELQVITGYLTEHAAFTAYDAGHHDIARSGWHEALTIARITDDDPLAVYVLAELANQAAYLGQGREVVELTGAAQQISRGFATPRLAAVLAAREAEGHALRGDASAAQSALSRAERELTDATDDDTGWSTYFTPEMLALAAARTWLALGAPVAAERAAAASLGGDLARRPAAMNAAVYARTLVAAGRLDQGAHAALAAIEAGRGVASERMRSELGALAAAFDGHDSVPGVAEARHSLTACLQSR